MFEVKKIELPVQSEVRGRNRLYPFDQCDVGEGFEVPPEKVKSVRSSLQAWKRTRGKGQLWRTATQSSGWCIIQRIE